MITVTTCMLVVTVIIFTAVQYVYMFSYSYYKGRLAILCTIAMRNLRNVYTFLPLYLLSGFLICTIWMSRLVIPLSSKLKFKLQSGLKPGY